MNTYELIASLKIKEIYGKLPEKIESIHHDSRQSEPNSLFACLRGFTVDGHDYYLEAIKNGASIIVAEEKLEMDLNENALIVVKDSQKALAILSSKFYGYPSQHMTVFGVTGTNGKTTVTTLIKNLLQKNNCEVALSGTNGFDFDNEISPSNNTTCDVLTNQKMLHKAYKQGIENMIMEVSSHGLIQGRLWGIDFDIVTFTNLTQDHLDFHNTMDQYGNTKSLLFSQLGNDLSQQKVAVLNKDESWYEAYNSMTPFEVISYALYSEADFKAVDITYYEDETHFTLLSPEGKYFIQTKLLGEFNVYNILAAIASVYANGDHSVADLARTVKDIEQVNGRMQKLEVEVPISVYIDYAHTPDAIEKSISSVFPFKQNRVIFVAGTGGDRDALKRPIMAEKASAADYVILTVNDPRFEDPSSILYDMEKGMRHDNYEMIPDRKEAIMQAIDISEPGDIIIIAGKGQEDYQIIEDKKYPHNDMEIALEKCMAKFHFKV
ncbi:UDP-N-acetylmuramoyl-L-alanyl-D-glutamate--2,6-diaminopimelate ligase [Oceanobacillus saliphilus]|uniref:UDP-N-acetylmuramoyl-L-alanyl-D-glutamate--2, 6-diaminopimelate ligase n=1 Tax=Oceanobacillus saliphilus TaxID=2925834 RepID=UPI00201D3E66|nr:UDP-N-acetylmuramoyl-L-alanyl-D-glutamate--2,6-diaminopimelate ligase [Oceanobacillus saliphilus]